MEKIKEIISMIVAVLLLAAVILLLKTIFNQYYNVPNYRKAICTINENDIEINIKKIKNLGEGNYIVEDDQDSKWLLSTNYCTFVEE